MTRARAMSIGEEAAHASDKQRSQLFIAGLEKPAIVFSGRINQTFPTHDMVTEFAYDGVVDGAFADVEPGMSVWIGTSIGECDLGICRARKAPTAGLVYIGETSEIDFSDDVYFSVMDEMLIDQRHVKIINKEIFFDTDVEYDDQNVNFDPIVIMGCDAVVDVTAYPVEVRFPNIADSSVFDSTITGYLMTANDGVVTDETTDDPILTISSYPANGKIRVKLTVTAANGKSFSGYRYVHVYDATHRPFTVFNLGNCRGSYDSGYWSFDVAVNANVSLSEVRDRASVILFAKDWYGDVKMSYGQLEHRENIVCLGWVSGEAIAVSQTKKSGVGFRVEGMGFWLEKMQEFPPSVRMAKNVPVTWVDVTGLTVDRAVWCLLHWHSTLTAIADVYLSSDTRYALEFDVPSDNVWGQVREISAKSILANPGSDRFGRFFLEIDPQLTREADRDWPVLTTLTSADWKGKIDLRRRVVDELSLIDVSGVNVNQSGGGSAFFSLANGHVFKHFGSPYVFDRLLVENQAQLNELAGLLMSVQNMEFDEYGIELASNNRMVDVFPRMFIAVTIEVEDTIRGIYYNGNAVLKGVSFEWNSDTGSLTTSIELENETTPELSINGDIPPETGIDSFDMGKFPTPAFPALPPIPLMFLPPSLLNLNLPNVIVIASDTHGVMFSDNVNNGDITKIVWQSMNNGLTAFQQADIVNMLTTPGGQVYVLLGSGEVYRAPEAGGTFYLVASSPDFTDINGKSTTIVSIGVNPLESDQVLITSGGSFHPGDFTPSEYWLGCSRLCIGGSLGAKSSEFYIATYYASTVFCNGQWFIYGCKNRDAAIKVFVSDASGEPTAEINLSYLVGQSANTVFAASAGTQSMAFSWDNTGALNGYDRVEDDGATVTNYITPTYPRPYRGFQGMSPSPTGEYILMTTDGVTQVKQSTDHGASWINTALTVGPSVLENCRDDNRWIFGGGANIKITLDRGATSVELIGNLLYVAPFINITHIRFVS